MRQDEVALNEILIRELAAETALVLDAPLFLVEANNAVETRVLATPAAEQRQTQYLVSKRSVGAILETRVPDGELRVTGALAAAANESRQGPPDFYRILMRPRL